MKNLKSIGQRVVADGTVKLRIRCVGFAESTAHYADAVVVSATSLVLSIDGVADTTFSGGSGTLAFATYTTLGALADQINSSPNWEAEIVAGLRSDTVSGSELLARSTSTFRMYQQVNLFADSSDNGVLKVGVLVEPNKPFDTVHGLDSMKPYHQARVGIRRLRSLINTNAGEVTAITVYELAPDKAAPLRTLAVFPGTDNTVTDSGQTDTITVQADHGNSLLIELSSTGTGWIDTGAYLDVEAVREQA